MPYTPSPLRYPGGKGKLFPILSEIIINNNLEGGEYVEPFAGGASAALSLLFNEYVEKIILNDADPCIYAFWNSILNHCEEFIELVSSCPLNISEWERQRTIYRNHNNHSDIEVGFACFYLNRCNRSGIIVNGGPIGGIAQKGTWKINARFNKEELIRRIKKIGWYKGRIFVYNQDAIAFLQNLGIHIKNPDRTLVYLDPPYYSKGNRLYLNYYNGNDHNKLASFAKSEMDYLWLMTYDNCIEIQALYSHYKSLSFDLGYSAYSRRRGKELMIFCDRLKLPRFPDNYSIAC